jgi:flagellar hook-basal body complex protein FliE
LGYGVTDPLEFEAERRRKIEEQNKIKQIMEKQMREQNSKRDFKNNAREFLENFNQKRQKANEIRHRSNNEEEKVFLETRENAKQSVNFFDYIRLKILGIELFL